MSWDSQQDAYRISTAALVPYRAHQRRNHPTLEITPPPSHVGLFTREEDKKTQIDILTMSKDIGSRDAQDGRRKEQPDFTTVITAQTVIRLRLRKVTSVYYSQGCQICTTKPAQRLIKTNDSSLNRKPRDMPVQCHNFMFYNHFDSHNVLPENVHIYY